MENSFKISSETIARAKAFSIVDLLSSQGFEPCKQAGNELVYRSPLRNESTASFFVNPVKNCFNDFGSEEHKGDVITLAGLLWKVDFRSAVEKVYQFTAESPPSFSFSGVQQPEPRKSKIEIISVKPLKHPSLINYVRQRCISLRLAKSYLHEVTYRAKGKQYFAVGFKNDRGGYELRNGLGFKGGKTENGISTIEMNTDSVTVFEGFFDFLSAMQYYGREIPLYTSIVLNTCNNIYQALPLLANRKAVHCFLDNDESGRKALQRLKNEGLPVKDWSSKLYPNSKDFNDYLLQSRNTSVTNGK